MRRRDAKEEMVTSREATQCPKMVQKINATNSSYVAGFPVVPSINYYRYNYRLLKTNVEICDWLPQKIFIIGFLVYTMIGALCFVISVPCPADYTLTDSVEHKLVIVATTLCLN